jgi:hypothetical protein
MHIEARCPKGELIRNGLVALLMLFFSAWLFWDGFVTYPRLNLMYAVENLPVGWPKVPEEVPWPAINPKITPEEVRFIQNDMKVDEVIAALGDPGLKHGQELRYFGPTGFLVIKTLGDRVVKSREYFDSKAKTASAILTQKVMGVVCLLLGGVLAVRFLRMALLKTVLTDEGLSLNGIGPITWEEMVELDNSEYQRKAWVYLQHTHAGMPPRAKLDSYRINQFREIIGEICDRKGFQRPFKAGTIQPRPEDISQKLDDGGNPPPSE